MTRVCTSSCLAEIYSKIVGLNIFQASVFVFYISIAKVTGARLFSKKASTSFESSSARIDSHCDRGWGCNDALDSP